MIRSLKTEINIKQTDISRLNKKVKRLDEANDMRHEFIQTHFKKTFKPKPKKERVSNSSVIQEREKEGVTLPPLNNPESKKNIMIDKTKTPLKQRRKKS